MKPRRYYYPANTVRTFRWTGDGDVRGYRPPRGWEAQAALADIHPVTQKPLKRSEWWVVERKLDDL